MKRKLHSLTIITLTFIVFISLVPAVSAKSRVSYLTDFVFQNQVDDEMFSTSYEDTLYALEIIHFYVLESQLDKSTFIENLETKISDMFDSGDLNLYDIYYILESLKLLNELETLDSDYKDKIHEYITQTEQNNGGFAFSNTSKSASLISTYFVYNIYNLIEEPFPNSTRHIDWILSCNNTDGGYGGNKTLSSTILTTFYAIYLIKWLTTTVDLLVNKTATLNYLESFYGDDPDDLDNYGGFLPIQIAPVALLSSTYYCIQSIQIINASLLNYPDTINWVLNRQNFQDGGFVDDPKDLELGLSSIPASYHAFRTLYVLNAIDYLNQDVFLVEFNYIILIILLSIIGIIAVIIIYIWRKRRL